MKWLKYFALLVVFITTTYSSCSEKPIEEESSNISLDFKFRIDNNQLLFDTLNYFNAAGNHYLVNEIQFFISDVTLHKHDGQQIILDGWNDIIYIDSDIPETMSHHFPDEISPGTYDSISFTFGMNEEKNQSLMFVNPPESFMFWPELLGGGYHYMKLNGKWLDTANQISPFNFHLGIGQIYESYPDEISAFVHNHFEVYLPNSAFEILPGESKNLELVMNVENWFMSPNTYDHNFWGGDIMQNQEAMNMACENGRDVFTLEK